MALTTILISEAVPPQQLGAFASKINVALVMSLVLGPVLGGAISMHTTWRWIFLINIPIYAVVLLLIFPGIPHDFPYHDQEKRISHPKPANLARLDIMGSTLIFLASLSFTACFQEAGSRFAWSSPYVIVLLVASVFLWVLTLVWERHLTLHGKIREPVLPWRFFTDRARLAVILYANPCPPIETDS
ncbi:hypothetical protein HIM_07506 [Hirsutella minnesotensis 3608]|uniref:Major facilitator superfamily (MFS) profile domain-containing protein n=1 Tax=Hirsutella minnesotensis 3608 TaxID=1043627 RepID=A0A0F7ZYV3_9HYPO|nr:hypothetical protein HIM_07506 [Hirsutella minnesotensis 3608]